MHLRAAETIQKSGELAGLRIDSIDADDDSTGRLSAMPRSAKVSRGWTVRSQMQSSFPKTLKLGDIGLWFSQCGIVHVSVQTDRGWATYSFAN